MITGPDVSVIQRGVPWDRVVGAGHRFALLRCGVGNDKPDTMYVDNVAGARGVSLAIAPYHFPYPLPHLDPIVQAEGHFKAAQGIGNARGDLPPMLDLEWPSRDITGQPPGLGWKKWGCSKEQIRTWCLAYAKRMRELCGRKPMIYTYPWWWQTIEGASCPEFAEYYLCLASYGHKPKDGELFPVIKPWARTTLLQYDGNGGEALPNGVDSDFNAFQGDDEAFAELLTRTDNDPVFTDDNRPLFILPGPPDDPPPEAA